MQNPYPVCDQNGQNQLKSIPYLWPKRLKNPTLGAAHTYIAKIRRSSPRRACYTSDRYTTSISSHGISRIFPPLENPAPVLHVLLQLSVRLVTIYSLCIHPICVFQFCFRYCTSATEIFLDTLQKQGLVLKWVNWNCWWWYNIARAFRNSYI